MFSCCSISIILRALAPRSGETVISKFEAVEDTKGNNGASGNGFISLCLLKFDTAHCIKK